MKTCRGEYCAAPNCSNNRGRCKHLSFFRFPKDVARCKRWIGNSRRTDLTDVTPFTLNSRYSLCADHFEETMFMNINERNRLVHDAVPTIFDELKPCCLVSETQNATTKEVVKRVVVEDVNEIEMEDASSIVNRGIDHLYSIANCTSVDAIAAPTHTLTTCTGTGDKCGAGAVRRYHRDNLKVNQSSAWQQTDPPSRRDKVTSTSRVLKTVEELRLRKIIRRQCKQMTRMQKQIDNLQEKLTKATKSYKVNDLIEGSQHYLNGLARSFFNSQLLLSSKKAQGKRWPDDVKKFIVSIYRTSPKAFRLLSRVFILPSKKSIRKVAVAEGDSIENAINSVVKSSFDEEVCVSTTNEDNFQVCLDNMSEIIENAGENNKIDDPSELTTNQSVDSENLNFQPLDDILQLTDNMLQTAGLTNGENETVIESGADVILDFETGVSVVTQHIQSEDGNISVIYPSAQVLQQILPPEVYHYMVQQS